MNIWMHSTIAATSLVATLAVAFVGITMIGSSDLKVSAKADRLPMASTVAVDTDFMTIESRGERLSVLSRIPVTTVAAK